MYKVENGNSWLLVWGVSLLFKSLITESVINVMLRINDVTSDIHATVNE
jgi:hypothetical protein